MLRSTFSSLREYLTPVSHESSFQQTGQLTPEEFVKAGDYLVYKFPTWSWASASSGKRKDYLPENKQFLVTKHVPCSARASSQEPDLELVKSDGGDDAEDEWIVNRIGRQGEDKAPEPVLDVEDLDAMGIEEEPDFGHSEGNADEAHLRQELRTYNVYITYSTSYRVPKAYLSGFDANGAPLAPKLMFDDIVGDYKDKTVTIESAPFQSNLTLISIHPCRHAGVMRMLLDMADSKTLGESRGEIDEWEDVPQGLRVDQYLVVFLKFIASVTPTIEYDFTMSAL